MTILGHIYREIEDGSTEGKRPVYRGSVLIRDMRIVCGPINSSQLEEYRTKLQSRTKASLRPRPAENPQEVVRRRFWVRSSAIANLPSDCFLITDDIEMWIVVDAKTRHALPQVFTSADVLAAAWSDYTHVGNGA